MTDPGATELAAAVRANIDEQGTAGRPVLVLHGGGGPFTVAPLAAHFAASGPTLTPTHPGWSGTPRPESLRSVHDLAVAYLDLLHERELTDVVLVGSSIGGWIALDMAATAAESGDTSTVGAVVSIDGTGIDVASAPAADFAALDARGRAEVAWHDPDLGYRDPASMSEAELAVLAGNAATMATIAGVSDPALPERLGAIAAPTLFVWGASDRVVTPAYGRAYAEAGHLPHLEQPAATLAAIDRFLAVD
jgi:pimeloyl-ACP methyl ester carboxylesterase